MLLVTGGCRSGKSDFARRWVEEQGRRFCFIATAYVTDAEMAARIERHQNSRGEGWFNFEAASADVERPELWVPPLVAEADALLFDCLTLWTSLCMERGHDETALLALTKRLLHAFASSGKPVALVSNELGMGLVPDSPLGRSFRDMAGLVNQIAARQADEVVFMVSGLPLFIKKKPGSA